MPFTLAHPAAVVPLKKLIKTDGLILSALVAGSLVPDLGYFWPGSQSQIFTHSLPGIVIFGLPVGIILLWLFHHWLKQALLLLLPPSHQRALEAYSGPFLFFPWRRLALILLSLFIGGLTHIAWDAFTHGQGWGVQTFDALHRPMFRVIGLQVKPYHLIKHGSSTLGMVALAYWYAAWYFRQRGHPLHLNSSRGMWVALVVILFGAVILSGIVLGLISRQVGYNALSMAVRWGLVVGILGLISGSLFFRHSKLAGPEPD